MWDHWVPGANNTLTKLCNEWGEKNKVEVTIDYITSQGDKDILTASAEAQARAGHDIMSHRAWQIQVHRRVLEPLDDVVKKLIAKAGPISPVAEYLAKAEGKWFGIPTTVGSQVKPCCSRIDLYKQHCGIDLTAIFPANPNRDPKLVDSWNWDLYLKTRASSCSRPASRSVCPWARPATPSTRPAPCSAPSARSWSTRRTTSRSIPTRRARRWNISRSSCRSIRRKSMPGTTPATTAGSSPARGPAS